MVGGGYVCLFVCLSVCSVYRSVLFLLWFFLFLAVLLLVVVFVVMVAVLRCCSDKLLFLFLFLLFQLSFWFEGRIRTRYGRCCSDKPLLLRLKGRRHADLRDESLHGRDLHA